MKWFFVCRKLTGKRLRQKKIWIFLNKNIRNYANYDHNALCDKLSGIELIPSGDINTCVNDLWHSFSSAFVSIANRHAPVIQKLVRGIDNCPWLNRDIKYDIRQRDYLVKKARKTNLSEDWKRYRCLRNRVTNKIKAAKACYNRQLIEENSGDSKAFWRNYSWRD